MTFEIETLTFENNSQSKYKGVDASAKERQELFTSSTSTWQKKEMHDKNIVK